VSWHDDWRANDPVGFQQSVDAGRIVPGLDVRAMADDERKRRRENGEPTYEDKAVSGQMRCRFRVMGGHVHCAMFGPFDGKAGDLTFRVDEWDHVRRTHPNWRFEEVT
jgi:hypothetical protein